MLAAAPEGRGCVVALNARVSDEADREAVEHLVDTFEADCGAVTEEPLASPSESDAIDASASASGSASSGATSDPSGTSAAPALSEDLDCSDFASQAEA